MLAVTSPPPDDLLVARARQGDRAAFGQLVDRHGGRLFGAVVRILGDAAVAEEVVQDALVAAWRALPKFRGDARFDTWLHRIAVNKARNKRLYRRRRALHRHDPLHTDADDDRPPLQLVHPGPLPDRAVDRAEASRRLQAGLDALTAEHREVLVLRDLQDLDYDEIADVLGIARGTVKSRLHRARAALAEAITALETSR